MGVNMSIPAAYDECLSQTEQLEWLYRHKENLLTAGANIRITRSGDTVVISAEGEGFSPTVSVETIPGGHRVTITDGEGPHVFDVMDGAPGQDGTDGTDGTSVSFSTETIQGGTRVFLEDGTHSSSFDVMDGRDGEDITITDVSVISSGTQVTFSDDTVVVIPNGLTGPTGPSGQNGRNVFIKYADEQPTQDSDMKDAPSAFMGVYSGTATTAPSTYTDYLWYQIKGGKGDTGNTGASGQDGVSPAVTIGVISGGHSVTITDAEHPGGQTFNVMDGENAAAATVTVGSTTTGQPGSNASVTNSGTSSDAVLDFVIPRGNPGPAAYVWTTDDDYTTPNYTFDIADLDGVSGETPKVGDIIFQNVNHRTFLFKINTVDTTTVLTDYFCEITGATGAAGADGSDGVTPEISATASADATHSATPTVTVTKSGTDAQPSFAFAFSGLAGEQGAAGQGVPSGGSGNQVLSKVNATDYNTEWKTIGLIPTGGTSGQVLTKTGSSNYQMAWSTPSQLPSSPKGALVADGTDTAVWLGPNNVDPTLDVGKVLTLQNTQSDPSLPPIIVPQWASAGGGSGGVEEWVDVTVEGGFSSVSMDLYAAGQASAASTITATSTSHTVYIKPIVVGNRTMHAVRVRGPVNIGSLQSANGIARAVLRLGNGNFYDYQYQGVTYSVSAADLFVGPASFSLRNSNTFKNVNGSGSVLIDPDYGFRGQKLELNLYVAFPANGIGGQLTNYLYLE